MLMTSTYFLVSHLTWTPTLLITDIHICPQTDYCVWLVSVKFNTSSLLTSNSYSFSIYYQSRGININSVISESSRTFKNKQWEGKYLKGKINELQTDNKNKNKTDLYREINEFRKGYQRNTNLIKGWNCNPLADFHNILNRCKNCFCGFWMCLGVYY